MTTQQAESARPFSCKTCKKKFSQLSHLQFHQRVHSKTKPFTCRQCNASFRQQYLLQQHLKTSHPVGSTGPIICKLCQKSFGAVAILQSHLVKSHSAYIASRTGKCVTKEKHKVLNGAHKKATERASGVMRNGAMHDMNDNHACTELNNGANAKRVSGNSQESQPDRTTLHLDIEPAINTVPMKHQVICSPDSTTGAFGITKTDPITLPQVNEDSKDSLEEPKWYLGAPDGKMEEMRVSYREKHGHKKPESDMEDNVSQGSIDTDDIDVISSALDSPVCQLSPRELQVEPSSTTSPGAPTVGHSPGRSPEDSPIISIDSTPVASPTCPRVGSSPAFLADDTSQPTTIEACESEPASPGHRDLSPNAELLYGQCGDSDDDFVKRRVPVENQRRGSMSSDFEIDVETDGEEVREEPLISARQITTPGKNPLFTTSVSEGLDSLQDSPPERARGLNVSPEKNTVDTPVKVAEDVFNMEDQESTEPGEDAESLGSSTGCMPLLEQMPLQSSVHDSPRARHFRRQSSKDDMPVIDKEMPCIEKEFPVLERQTSISPDYRRCDVKEELTSSTDQESPNSTGADVEQLPPDIRPHYGPSIAPGPKTTRESSEKPPRTKPDQKADSESAYFGDDDQYTGSTEEEDPDNDWTDRHGQQNGSEGKRPIDEKIRAAKGLGRSDRQMGFFDVFANFLQNKEQEVEEDEEEEETAELEERKNEETPDVVKEKKRAGRSPKRKPAETQSKPDYNESSEEDLGEFRVETADPTVLKISRVSPGSRTPVRSPEPKTETAIPQPQPHMVASTNGTVVTLRRIPPAKPDADPVHDPSDHESTNPKSGQDVPDAADVKTEPVDGESFTDNNRDQEKKVTDASGESQDTNSGTYTLRKRKKVNFNLLAEGNLSDNDFIPDPPEPKKGAEFVESPHKKNGRARKKKPFDKVHFMNYNRRLLRLRKGVCVLLETLFPEMVYPRRFNPESHAVDYFVDYIYLVVQDKELTPTRISRCYGEIDWDPTVMLCSTPKDCLRHLRRRLMKMLKALLPGLKVNRYFDHSSASVDALIEEITFVNAQNASSQMSHPNVPLPSDLDGASPTCTAAKPKAIDTKRRSRNSGRDSKETSVGESTTHRSPTAKRKRAEYSTDGEATAPAPVASSGSNVDDPPAKKQHKNPSSSTGKSVDDSQSSTSTTATGSSQISAS